LKEDVMMTLQKQGVAAVAALALVAGMAATALAIEYPPRFRAA